MATFTVKSSGGDYTSLSAALSDNQGDLTGTGPLEFECYDVDDTDVAVNGYTTTPSDYIRIYAASGARCNGSTRAQTGNTYRVSGTISSGQFRVDVRYLRVEGIEIKASGAQVALSYFSGADSSSDIRFDDCVFHTGDSSASTSYVIEDGVGSPNVTYTNCLVFGKRRGIDSRNNNSATLNHCTFYTDAADLGLVCSSEATITNTYSGGYSNQCFLTGGSAPTGSHNCSSDGTASTNFTSSLVNKASVNQFSNPSVDGATVDFSVISGADVIGAGTGSEAQDITDTSRDSNPDIGAFEFSGGGGSTATFSGDLQDTLPVTAGSFTTTNRLNSSLSDTTPLVVGSFSTTNSFSSSLVDLAPTVSGSFRSVNSFTSSLADTTAITSGSFSTKNPFSGLLQDPIPSVSGTFKSVTTLNASLSETPPILSGVIKTINSLTAALQDTAPTVQSLESVAVKGISFKVVDITPEYFADIALDKYSLTDVKAVPNITSKITVEVD